MLTKITILFQNNVIVYCIPPSSWLMTMNYQQLTANGYVPHIKIRTHIVHILCRIRSHFQNKFYKSQFHHRIYTSRWRGMMVPLTILFEYLFNINECYISCDLYLKCTAFEAFWSWGHVYKNPVSNNFLL